MDAQHIESVMQGHERIALQFSGGRDSLAVLHLMQPWWPRMTVYHLDTGDQYPETRFIADWARQRVPLAVIRTDVAAWRDEHGWPSDVVPASGTPLGQKVDGAGVRVSGRYECCWRNLMWPMHERMVRDGITLIVRGQRNDEYATPPLRSGDWDGGMQVLYPIEDWTADDVNAYCRANSLPLAPWYEEGIRRGPECLHCTAWWDDGRLPYVRRHHPAAYGQVMFQLKRIGDAVTRQFEPLCDGMEDRS